MSELHWDELGGGVIRARGGHWTYLIELTDWRGGPMARLTRYTSEYAGPGRHGREADAARVAAQAATYVIELAGVARGYAPGEVAAYARDMAQAFEAGRRGRDHGSWPRVELPAKGASSA